MFMTLGFLRQEELATASRGGRWRPVISLDSVTYLHVASVGVCIPNTQDSMFSTEHW